MQPAEPAERDRVEQARAQLPALQSSIYLNTGTSGPIPSVADEAMRQLEDYELRYGRATMEAHEELVARVDECRAAVAAVLHASPESIALTRSTTDGINAGIWSLPWRPGDEVITTSLEHPGLLAPLAALGERGIRVRVADVGDGGDDSRTIGAIERLVGPRTVLVAVSHVAWTTGAVLPVGRIAAVARAAGARALVDGAQSGGAIDVDPAALDVDFYAVPAQKWLLGPEGMGALWASGPAIESAVQSYAGWWTTEEATAHADPLDPGGLALRPWSDARRFDTTGLHGPSVVAFGRSVGWLAMHVGLPWLHGRGARLARRVADELAAIPGISLLTPRERMATLVSFRIRGWRPDDARDAIRRHSFAIVRTVPGLDALRASIGWFNSEAELDRFLETVALVASQTPESLPPRGQLTILAE